MINLIMAPALHLRNRYLQLREVAATRRIDSRLPALGRIRTHLTSREKLALYGLARSARPRVTVEIGSYVGASAAFLAAGLRDGATAGSKIFCIDTWNNDAMTEGEQDTWTEFRANTKGFEKLIVPLRGWSTGVAKDFDESVDLLFIDGDHSYEGVSADVDAWLPKLSAGSIIMFHDIGWAEGVQRVVKERISPIASRTGRLPNLFWAWIG